MTDVTLPPDVEKFAAFVRNMKEELVAEPQLAFGGAGDDLPPVVEARRNGRQVAMAMAPVVNRDQGLVAAKVLADAFAADELWFVTDAHMSRDELNPLSGKPWAPGEMQRACDGEGACELGLITDCMMINRVDRALRHSLCLLPYHVHHGEGTMRWVDDIEHRTTDDEGFQVDGVVPGELESAMRITPRPHMRAYGIAFLQSRGYTVWAEPSIEDTAGAMFGRSA